MKDEDLPGLLPDNQLYELLDKAKQDDKDAVKTVAEHNIKLVLLIVNKIFGTIEWACSLQGARPFILCMC